MPSHYDTHAFDEQNTEDAAGKGSKKKKKKRNIKTPDNFGFGDMSKEARELYLKMRERELKRRRGINPNK